MFCRNRLIRKVTLFLSLLSPLIPSLFQWYLQSKEILLNLSMKCWVSTFKTQQFTRLESNDRSCPGRSSEDICSRWRRSGKLKDGMKLSLPPKLVGKLVWVLVISLCKIFIPSERGMLCDVETGRSHPLIVRLFDISNVILKLGLNY
jgi:hypothetical protein